MKADRRLWSALKPKVITSSFARTERTHFLTAFSRQRPLRKLGDVISADDLSGFDGVFHWRLTLNSPTELRTEAEMADLSLPPLKSINHLTIIPKTEAERKQGLFQADAQLAAINGFAGECLSVVQFGFAQELRRALQVDAGTLELQGSGKRNLIATIKGESAHPTELSYGEPTGQKTTTTFDYEKNTLAIKRSAGGKVFFESRYHLLGVRAPEELRLQFWGTLLNECTDDIRIMVTAFGLFKTVAAMIAPC